MTGIVSICVWVGYLDGVYTERNRRNENHYRDTHANSGISVESSTVVREPDDGRCDYDADVVCAVAEDVDHDAHHCEVSTFVVGSLGVVCVVLVVDVLGCVRWVCRSMYEPSIPFHQLVLLILTPLRCDCYGYDRVRVRGRDLQETRISTASK